MKIIQKFFTSENVNSYNWTDYFSYAVHIFVSCMLFINLDHFRLYLQLLYIHLKIFKDILCFNSYINRVFIYVI